MKYIFTFGVGAYVGFLITEIGYNIMDIEFWGYVAPFVLLFILRDLSDD